MKKKSKPGVTEESHIKAVTCYNPRIIHGRIVEPKELAYNISRMSGLHEGMAGYVLKVLTDAMLYHFQRGRPVRVEELGIFKPQVTKEGKFTISHIPSVKLRAEMNKSDWFEGDMKNRDMIGAGIDDLIARWNADHPDDPIE